MANTKLCVSCMTQVDAGASHCTKCGYNGTQHNADYALGIGTRLTDRYVVGMVSDFDGQTITYVGYDLKARERVVICEYMPTDCCTRTSEGLKPVSGAEIHVKTGLSDFTELYTTLRGVSDESGLVPTTDFFTLNNTAYAVLDYFDGITLEEFLKLKKKPLTYEQCAQLFAPIIQAVSTIHSAKLIHRGISPETILLRGDGIIKLSGFATSAVRSKGTEYKARLFDGYTAPEQYAANTFISPAADVYSLAACVYRAMTGTVPPDATRRRLNDSLASVSELASDAPAFVSTALSAAMIINPKQRLSDVSEFRAYLFGERSLSNSEDTQEPVQPAEPEEDPGERLFRRSKTFAIASACLMVLMVGMFFLWQYLKAASDDGTGSIFTPPEEVLDLSVPNLVGKTYTDKLELNPNFKYVIEKVHNGLYDEDVIYGTSPSAGSVLAEGGTVTIRVSLGEKIVQMPNVIRMTAANATAALDALGIPHTYETELSNTATPRLVIKQSIPAGKSLVAGIDEVVLTVSMSSGGQG